MVDARVPSANFRSQKRVRGDFNVQVLAREIHRHQHGDVGFLTNWKNEEAVGDLKSKSELLSRTEHYCYKCSQGRIQDFPDAEGANLLFGQFFLKTAWIWTKLDQGHSKFYFVDQPLAE